MINLGEKWNLATSRSFGDKHFKLDSDKPPVLGMYSLVECIIRIFLIN